jgi:hypothetical protein
VFCSTFQGEGFADAFTDQHGQHAKSTGVTDQPPARANDYAVLSQPGRARRVTLPDGFLRVLLCSQYPANLSHVAVIVATQVPGERGPPPGASIDADEALARTFQDEKLPAWMVDADGELAKMMHVRTPTLRCCPCRLNVLACLCFNPGRTFHGPHATGFGIRAVPWCDTVESCPLVHVLTVFVRRRRSYWWS